MAQVELTYTITMDYKKVPFNEYVCRIEFIATNMSRKYRDKFCRRKLKEYSDKYFTVDIQTT